MTQGPPDHPAGKYVPREVFEETAKRDLIDVIRAAPQQLRAAIGGLSQSQLDTHYKNWTIRQITHHLADSHLHSIIRCKWALTEEHPTIKAYEEGDWVQLADSQHGDIEPALHILEGLHAKWVQLLESMNEAQFARTFFHPQTETSVNLWMALNSYAWHGRHHTAQIRWLRDRHGW